MLSNFQVEKTIQQVAKSIAAVLDVEIVIVDKNFKIVGGTAEHQGRYKISNNAIYRHIMLTREPVIIENPGFNKLCKTCKLYKNCPETAEIDYPIIVDNEIVGIISLVGLTAEHRELMLSRKNDYLTFLERMSELIATKASEVLMAQKLEYVAQQLTHIINSVQEGIIAVGNDGIITHFNEFAEKILKVPAPEVLGEKVGKAIPSFHFEEAIQENAIIADKEVRFRKENGETVHCYISANPIKDTFGKKVLGAIVTLKDAKDIKKMVSNMMGFHSKDVNFMDIIGKSNLLTEVKQKALKAAKTPSTVLIRGESGTGKELFARAIHNESLVHRGPFITINCAAIPETLLESELFGYEGGAFTGAKKEGKPGKFELADGGTLFLDEIGDMSLYLQAKLLRALQDKRVQRVGGLKEIPVNVRIIAATNKNLEELVVQNRFREDLFYRLNVIPIIIPPLAERKEDIPDLIEYLLKKYNILFNKNIVAIDDSVRRLFTYYSWPGNVRELENVLEYAINMENGNQITLKSIPEYLVNFLNTKPDKKSLQIMIEDFEKKIIEDKIQSYGFTLEAKNKIADELGIGIASLYRKLKKYKLN